jgi:hypothetical protein
MGCNCGKNKAGTKSTVLTANGKRAKIVGYQVCYPNGTCTPESEPIFSMVEARRMIRGTRGSTIKRLLKEVA